MKNINFRMTNSTNHLKMTLVRLRYLIALRLVFLMTLNEHSISKPQTLSGRECPRITIWLQSPFESKVLEQMFRTFNVDFRALDDELAVICISRVSALLRLRYQSLA